jgi:hypothetical protein
MIKLKAALFAILAYPLTSSAFVIDIGQSSISGNAPSSSLGSPFGQSFIPTLNAELTGIALALVNDTGASDLLISLYHTDSSGTELIGSPITTGFLTQASIHELYTPAVTPFYLTFFFDTPYAQTPGEKLAFTVSDSLLNFYYAPGSTYSGGSLLSDAGKDLTFATLVVPEPATSMLMLPAVLPLIVRRRRQ